MKFSCFVLNTTRVLKKVVAEEWVNETTGVIRHHGEPSLCLYSRTCKYSDH